MQLTEHQRPHVEQALADLLAANDKLNVAVAPPWLLQLVALAIRLLRDLLAGKA